MDPEETSQQWQQHSRETAKAMAQWRQAHPEATLAEIEEAVDAQVNQLRARMIEDVVKASPLEQAAAGADMRICPQCGQRMQRRGKQQRKLQTQGGQQVTLTRRYQSCPFCGYSFFPPR